MKFAVHVAGLIRLGSEYNSLRIFPLFTQTQSRLSCRAADKLFAPMATAEAARLSPTFIFTSEKIRRAFLASLSRVLKDGVCPGEVAIEIKDWSDKPAGGESSVDLTINDSHIPVLFSNKAPSWSRFRFDLFNKHLGTEELGRTIMYSELTSSTQVLLSKNVSFLSRIPTDAGLVYVALQQTQGKGRRDNKWVSPYGCLQFSAHMNIPKGSKLSSNIVFLQYICSLAVVKGVLGLPGYEDLNLRLKWPNDIYYGPSTKIGGVLVDCSSGSWGTSAILGCGVNVTNSQPTTCLNDIVEAYNKEHSASLASLSMELVLAATLNQLEALLNQFQKFGPMSFLDDYYERWLHSGSTVKLGGEASGEDVTIIGINDSGYLQVRRANHEIVVVQPDGNSFDMMHGLIIVRKA